MFDLDMSHFPKEAGDPNRLASLLFFVVKKLGPFAKSINRSEAFEPG